MFRGRKKSFETDIIRQMGSAPTLSDQRFLTPSSSISDCFYVTFSFYSLFIFYSHDDVIGKITLSKDAIGSQAKGTTEPIWSSEVKHTRPPPSQKVWPTEARCLFLKTLGMFLWVLSHISLDLLPYRAMKPAAILTFFINPPTAPELSK